MGLARAKRLAELFPDSAGLQREVARLYQNAALERGFDHDSTRPYWERAYELEPFLDGPAFRLLVLHMERGRLDEARSLVRNAASADFIPPFCYFLCTFLDIVGASSINARDSILYAAEAQRMYFANWAVPRTLTMQDSISIPRHILATIGGAWYSASQSGVDGWQGLRSAGPGHGGEPAAARSVPGAGQRARALGESPEDRIGSPGLRRGTGIPLGRARPVLRPLDVADVQDCGCSAC